MTSSKPKAKQGSDKGVEWEDKVIKAAVLSCENITFETFRSSPEALCRNDMCNSVVASFPGPT